MRRSIVSLGMTELLLILGIALIFFGPSRLPGLGKSMGQAIRGFKKGMEVGEDEEQRPTSPQDQITDSRPSTSKGKQTHKSQSES